MGMIINLEDIRSPRYFDNEYTNGYPCLICGKSVERIDKQFETLALDDAKAGLKTWSEKTKKYMNAHFLHLDTDGGLYFAYEDVATGRTSQGCFPIGCDCMRKYRKLRASNK